MPSVTRERLELDRVAIVLLEDSELNVQCDVLKIIFLQLSGMMGEIVVA